MPDQLQELADRGCERALAIAVEILDTTIAEGAIEVALSGHAEGLMRLVDARDTIIHAIAYAEGERTNGHQ